MPTLVFFHVHNLFAIYKIKSNINTKDDLSEKT